MLFYCNSRRRLLTIAKVQVRQVGADIQYDYDEAAASQTKETAKFFQVRQHFPYSKLKLNVKVKAQRAELATDQPKVTHQRFSAPTARLRSIFPASTSFHLQLLAVIREVIIE